MRLPTRLAVVLLAMLVGVAACESAVGPGRTHIGESFTVEPQIRWTSLPWAGEGALWTVDGTSLHALRLLNDVADGDTLLRGDIVAGGPVGVKTPKDKQPRFHATMTPSEIMDVVVDTWVLMGASQIEASGLRYFRFGNRDGFRFDLAFVWPDGVEARALVSGTVVRRRLYLIVYEGTRLHYFDKYRSTVDLLVDSARVQ
jgi:hypothetical protein